MSCSYTHTSETTRSSTRTFELDLTQTYNVPANGQFQVNLIVEIGQPTPTPYVTNARRWYDQPVTGGVPDPAHNNRYKRTEQVSGTVAGDLAGTSRVEV